MNRISQPGEATATTQRTVRSMAKKFNLLIVDDEESLRTILEAELAETGEFAVDTAADGGQAINQIQAKVYDIMLLDIRMPRVSGIEVLKFIQDYTADSTASRDCLPAGCGCNWRSGRPVARSDHETWSGHGSSSWNS